MIIPSFRSLEFLLSAHTLSKKVFIVSVPCSSKFLTIFGVISSAPAVFSFFSHFYSIWYFFCFYCISCTISSLSPFFILFRTEFNRYVLKIFLYCNCFFSSVFPLFNVINLHLYLLFSCSK